ncbi:MAG: hypothetical protein PHD43_13960 [Methylococcales bacterium]|nr:hypothetical protein [Methylococcales bacterium]
MAAMPDLPPSHHQQERIVCSIIAAEKYAVPANILLAIAEKENGAYSSESCHPDHGKAAT